ncbi:MAG TPA: shikimate kinase [Cytophagales bacterium]|nr:shikimate kinase [Cytophagales bacterium]
MRIYLIGITGCGKSTLGKSLAKSLGYEFIDLDDYIINKQGKSIDLIFEESGEAYFRKLEQEALHQLKGKKKVISTGGGAPCFFDNMDFMNTQGKTIWLNPDPEVVTDRLLSAPNSENRPLIKGKTREQIQEFIKQKLQERQKFYSRAEVIITHNNITAEMIANTLE